MAKIFLRELYEKLSELPGPFQDAGRPFGFVQLKCAELETAVKGTLFESAVGKFSRSVMEWRRTAPESLGILGGYYAANERDPEKIVLALGGPDDGYNGLLWSHCSARPTAFVECGGRKFLLRYSEFQRQWFGVEEAAAAERLAHATYEHSDAEPYNGPVSEIWHWAR